ncbi:Arc family DNA-binding protein [Clostridiaceae bacterium OttesenSCG-928-D20]|nr:Arc family DNA-binding protein [Clostridiaceae bacterium OttesenSCG-928-D20]
MAIKSLSIRIDSEMLNKLHVVADYEGRSANSQILILIRDCVKQFEKAHGEIGSENLSAVAASATGYQFK